ncbi:MAG: PAS domain-containing sensor histidine kinase [Cyclobacteriaceae bacterium]
MKYFFDIKQMEDKLTATFKHLSDLSEELHLVLGRNMEFVFANKALLDRIPGIENSTSILKSLGIIDNYALDAINDCLNNNETLDLRVDISLSEEPTSIQWKIVPLNDSITLIGKDLGNKEGSEGEKFAQAIKEFNIDQTGKGYSGHLTDIQRVLSEEVDKFKLISENVSDIVCLHDPHDARYLYVSPSCKTVTGYIPEEMEGRSPYDFFHPDMIRALEEDHKKREAGEITDAPSGPPPKMIYLFNTKERGFRWMESHSRPVFDKDGNVVLILSTSRDIHERIEAEKEKERYFNYYRTLGNNIPNGAVFMIDKEYNYLIAEGEEFEKLGRTSEYYVGKNARDIYNPERFKRLAHYFEKLFNGESVSFEWDFNEDDYIFLGRPCIEQDGTISAAILLTQNITESKSQANKLKLALAELEAKNFELDSFVYRTSHDLRSPLASVLGLVEIMLKESDINDLHDCARRIKGSVERLDTTVASILEYSRNGNINIEDHEVSIENIWTQCLDTHRNMPNAADIDFSFEGESQLIKTDPFRLSIIFNNLISNAIKYCDPNKKSFVKLSAKQDNGSLQLTLEDNGIGIPEDLQPNVFDMFYRASILSHGAGLGLYIVKKAVDKLGGKISLNSKQGIGTTFTIHIPPNSKVDKKRIS